MIDLQHSVVSVLQIVAAGNIIVSDSVQMYSRNKLFSVAISRDMSPSAKIVAFFIAPNGQVAADSLHFHVDGTKLHDVSTWLSPA